MSNFIADLRFGISSERSSILQKLSWFLTLPELSEVEIVDFELSLQNKIV